MNQFVVGKAYDWAERGFDPFTVLSRTAKTITVCNGTNVWKMLVRTDENGSEWVRDSSEPRYAQDMFVSKAEWVINDLEYGYRIVMRNESEMTLVFSEYSNSEENLAEVHMNHVAHCLEMFYKGYAIVSKELLRNGDTIKTY